MELHLGASVWCEDGPAGELAALIADPSARTLTHLAVEPRDALDARLVPIERVAAATRRRVELDCTADELDRLQPFHDVEFVPYVLVLGWPPTSLDKAVLVDRIPPREVELQRHDTIAAHDGAAGRLEGLVVGDDAGRISGLLARERHHLTHTHVVLPVELVEGFESGRILLHATRAQVAERERATSGLTSRA